MHNAANVLRVAGYQFSQLMRGSRIWLVFVCNFIFLQTQMIPLRNFLTGYEAEATPFLFPFLFMDPFLTVCFFGGMLLLFCNAPFFSPAQKFVAVRTGKKVWAMGQILYIACTGTLYFGILYAMSTAVLIPQLSLKNEWGNVWNTLARTVAGEQAGVFLIVPASVLNAMRPLETVGLVGLLGILNAVFLGELFFAFNIYWKKEVGIAVAVIFILLPTRASRMPELVRYLLPVSWMSLNGFPGDAKFRGPDLPTQLLILSGIIFVLGILCVAGCCRKEIPEIEE